MLAFDVISIKQRSHLQVGSSEAGSFQNLPSGSYMALILMALVWEPYGPLPTYKLPTCMIISTVNLPYINPTGTSKLPYRKPNSLCSSAWKLRNMTKRMSTDSFSGGRSHTADFVASTFGHGHSAFLKEQLLQTDAGS